MKKGTELAIDKLLLVLNRINKDSDQVQSNSLQAVRELNALITQIQKDYRHADPDA